MTYQLERYKNGQVVPWVLAEGDRIVGQITLSDLVPGPFRSAALGYWLAADALGRGLATLAVSAVAEIADTELKLHRIEASTLTNNAASQRVLQTRRLRTRSASRRPTCTSTATGKTATSTNAS